MSEEDSEFSKTAARGGNPPPMTGPVLIVSLTLIIGILGLLYLFWRN